jgi:hypothetical protein rflaF_17559
MKKNAYDMLYLTSCAINGIVPKKNIVKNVDLEKLKKFSDFHCLTSAVCTALSSAGAVLPKYWTDSKAKAIRKVILLDAERKKILKFMEKKGIWYMPLKGVILKELYPSLGMRQMSDNDILFDKRFADDFAEYMLSHDYSLENHKVYTHYSFQKPPVYNYEMHIRLFSKSSDFYQYYADVRKRLVKDKNNAYGYHFTDEDFYVYIMAHGAKHYENAGTGLRTLADCYIYCLKKPNLNREYIKKELKKLGLLEYENKTRSVAEKIFSKPSVNPDLTKDERIFLEDHMFSGTYGTWRNKIKKNKEKMGIKNNLQYLIKRLFPDMAFYRDNYPFFYHHKLLLPFIWTFRLLRGIRNKSVIREIKIVMFPKSH